MQFSNLNEQYPLHAGQPVRAPPGVSTLPLSATVHQALESDTRVLAYEAGRKWNARVNTISAGPLGSRAAKAIGFIDDMIRWASN